MKQISSEQLHAIDLFLFDLDGTVYLGNDPIPGALDFINHLCTKEKSYVFLTNNSSKAATDYVDKLSGMGFPVTIDQVATSGQATGWYIERIQPGAEVYVMGTEALKKELAFRDISILDDQATKADFVVAGFDTELTYNKLRTICALLDNGAQFIATNPDLVCPIENDRYIPDCGSMCILIENATGKKPKYIGKPETIFVDYLRARRGIDSDQIAMVGDRLYTDIALGCNASLLTICVLSGESDVSAIEQSPFKPDFIIESVADLLPLINKGDK